MTLGFIDINIHYMKLPRGCHGVSKLNPDGSFTVILDPNDSWEMQRHGCSHELWHIEHGDFDNIEDKDASEIECIAHHSVNLKGA